MHYKFWAYIVTLRSGTLYIGMTNHIERRMREHTNGAFEGFASKYGCNRLVYSESFDEVQEGINREKQFKGWTRAKKIALIQCMNPRWADLAERWGAQTLFAGESIKNGENSPRRPRLVSELRGPSTPQLSSPAKKAAAFRMTGSAATSLDSALENLLR